MRHDLLLLFPPLTPPKPRRHLFLANNTPEITGPASAIVGAITALRSSAAPGLSRTQADVVGTLEGAAAVILALARALHFARLLRPPPSPDRSPLAPPRPTICLILVSQLGRRRDVQHHRRGPDEPSLPNPCLRRRRHQARIAHLSPTGPQPGTQEGTAAPGAASAAAFVGIPLPSPRLPSAPTACRKDVIWLSERIVKCVRVRAASPPLSLLPRLTFLSRQSIITGAF